MFNFVIAKRFYKQYLLLQYKFEYPGNKPV